MSETWLTREFALASARHVARRMGYAVAVHGSLTKDLDLIAVPWVEDGDGVTLGTPQELVDGIAEALDWIYGPREDKPHGRVGWALRPHTKAPKGRGTDAWYIDLSVMPPSGLASTARRRRFRIKKVGRGSYDGVPDALPGEQIIEGPDTNDWVEVVETASSGEAKDA